MFPHAKLVENKKSQNWVRISGKLLVFPGGGTQFKDRALSYIDFIEEVLPNVAGGTRTRDVQDVGCAGMKMVENLYQRLIEFLDREDILYGLQLQFTGKIKHIVICNGIDRVDVLDTSSENNGQDRG